MKAEDEIIKKTKDRDEKLKMGINISTIAATIINFIVLIVIVGGIAKFFLLTTKIARSNGNIEKKLDKIIELLEKIEKEE